MPFDEVNNEAIESFRRYIEDSVATDDRYGPSQRVDQDDDSTLAVRFEAGLSCWFEVAACTSAPSVRVGFLATDPTTSGEIEQEIRDSGAGLTQIVGAAFGEAGLDWTEPPVERVGAEGDPLHLVTTFELDELSDLDRPEVLGKTLRMLEGYLLAFGPATIDEDDEGEPIEDLD